MAKWKAVRKAEDSAIPLVAQWGYQKVAKWAVKWADLEAERTADLKAVSRVERRAVYWEPHSVAVKAVWRA